MVKNLIIKKLCHVHKNRQNEEENFSKNGQKIPSGFMRFTSRLYPMESHLLLYCIVPTIFHLIC